MNFDTNNKAIYIQIAERICDEIVSGRYPEESRLPSVREFAADVQVNPNTVMRSYDRLSDQGLIYNKRGIGFFVSSGARERILAERKEELLKTSLETMFSTLMHLNISPDELRRNYAEYLERNRH